jgi:hypothetical protein
MTSDVRSAASAGCHAGHGRWAFSDRFIAKENIDTASKQNENSVKLEKLGRDRRGALKWQAGTGGDRSSGWSTCWPGEWHEVKVPNESELCWLYRLIHSAVSVCSLKTKHDGFPAEVKRG